MSINPRFLWGLSSARNKKMCMKAGCTTCGANPFLKGVQRTLGLEEFVPWATFFRRAQYRDLLIGQLALLNEDEAELNFDALKFFLTSCFIVNSSEIQTLIENELRSTSAGHILDRMKEHYEQRLAISALSDPELAKVRRGEKKKRKAEVHLKRIEFYRANPFVGKVGLNRLGSDE